MRLPRRFDDALMAPPEAAGEIDPALTAMLTAWCAAGAFPRMTEPLRAASIAPRDGLDGAACALDGSHELTRLGRWPGLAWRLRLLARECFSTDAARPHDPWDCGWWRAGPPSAAAAFRPRRPTLLMVRAPDADAADALLSTLRAASPAYTRPVRVLVVAAAARTGIERL
ncbi:MAG: hypothetical protein J7598_09470 [Mitsuaria chitosanitabida]|uniref:hypothetical protein n=1 Tax=Roseateles chitosanitabidus TaxID=65048 RepID=UPI001B0D89A2|nr:hypothetical protein [Roseateles chitosanitabidus]MBO9686830.1 hypothetical protein [Roseateles chitosanitabidus]